MTDPAAPPSSPCVKICVIDPASALCIGCGRTVAEISVWREMGESARHKVMAELPKRLADSRSRAVRGGRISAPRDVAALIAPIVIIAAAIAALCFVPAATPIIGLNHAQFAAAATGLAILASIVVSRGLLALLRAFVSAAVWCALIVTLWIGYNHRDDLFDLAQRAIETVDGAEPSVGKSGEVTIKRSFSGEFVVAAKVNDRPVKFIFDTGASTVVLTAEDAKRIGLNDSVLDFSAEVFTANGAAMAAPTRLAQIAVGPIVVRNVRALVTRPGAMEQSLLGMSFLEQLQSYGVERGRLTLKMR